MNSRRIVAVLLVVVLMASSLSAQQKSKRGKRRRRPAAVPPGVRLVRDLEFASFGNKSLRLDLYLPEKAKRPLPLIIWVHGGGWMSGSKDNCPLVGLSTRGFAVASIDYRLSQVAKYPAQIHDCRAAIRWLRAHAGEYELQVDKIGVAGSSAGGHLVALLGTSGGVDGLEGRVGGNTGQSSRVQAVCDFSGPSDFLQLDAHAMPGRPFQYDAPNSPASLLIGGDIQANPGKVARANPITFVDKNDPPFLIIHGDRDPVVPLHQSRLLYDALVQADVPAKLHIVKGAKHSVREFDSPEVRSMILKFFDKHIRK